MGIADVPSLANDSLSSMNSVIRIHSHRILADDGGSASVDIVVPSADAVMVVKQLAVVDGVEIASVDVEMASDAVAMASVAVAMASDAVAMASDAVAMASVGVKTLNEDLPVTNDRAARKFVGVAVASRFDQLFGSFDGVDVTVVVTGWRCWCSCVGSDEAFACEGSCSVLSVQKLQQRRSVSSMFQTCLVMKIHGGHRLSDIDCNCL